MDKKEDPIIMNSLLEEQEMLEEILLDWINSAGSTIHLEKAITNWANNLLMEAANNEPGQVNLLPGPDRERCRHKKEAWEKSTENPQYIDDISEDPPELIHQIIGSGSSNIRRSGKHQKLS